MSKLNRNIIEDIYKSSLKFLVPLSPKETLATIAEEAVKLVGGEYGSITLKLNDRLVRVHSSAPFAGDIQIQKTGSTYLCFNSGKPVLLTSAIFIPLTNKRKPVGVLTVNSKRLEQFSNHEADILQLFGSMASLAIRKTQLYDETKEALETRDIFISMASHELRTPITTISGYVQLLQSRIKVEDGVAKIWLDDLSKEVDRLTLLVEELLEINRIKSGKLEYHFKESNISEIIDRAVKTVQFVYPDKKIVLENQLGQDHFVIGDYDKLLQVANNILENAAKYSPKNKEIKITLKRKNTQLKIQVKDKGIGIPSKQLPEIFAGFIRGKNHDREGLGLGLFLTKSIVDKHLGSIRIKSVENRGTVVEVILPSSRINL